MQQTAQRPRVEWPERFNAVPKDIFHREDIYRFELERIFYGPEWHPVAHRAEVPKPGDFKTQYVGEASLLIVHGVDGELRVFMNSCPHRGTTLKTEARGSCDLIVCPYHRWTFTPQGELRGAPGTDDFPSDFRKEDFGLRRLRAEEVFGLLFVTFSDKTPPLRDYLGDTIPYIGKVLGDDGRLTLLGYQKVIFDCNWKLYNDNEGYHGPLLHTAFQLLQFRSGEGTQFMTANAHKVNCTTLPPVKDTGALKDFSIIEARDPKRPAQAAIVTLFPLAQMVKQLDVINVRHAHPLSPHRTEVHYTYFAHQDDDAALAGHRIRQASNLLGPSGFISLEDGAVFNRIQLGSATGGTTHYVKGARGPLSGACVLDKGDEAGNLVRWARYREVMGFDHG
ncbi:MAG: aromatic ring-hydroxylating dioxygenase subunit alpha [Steroidobacteraceae bacterium]